MLSLFDKDSSHLFLAAVNEITVVASLLLWNPTSYQLSRQNYYFSAILWVRRKI